MIKLAFNAPKYAPPGSPKWLALHTYRDTGGWMFTTLWVLRSQIYVYRVRK